MKYKNYNEEVLIDLAKDKDEDALRELIDRYNYLILGKSRVYNLISYDFDDILQEGTIAFVNAINSYNKESGSFKSYCTACVTNRLNSVYRADKNLKNKPLNEFLSISDDNDLSSDKNKYLSSSKYEPERLLLKEEEEKEFIKYLKDNLTAYEYQIVTNYIQGYSYKEIAEKVNKPIKSVDNALNRIKKKIAKIFSR